MEEWEKTISPYKVEMIGAKDILTKYFINKNKQLPHIVWIDCQGYDSVVLENFMHPSISTWFLSPIIVWEYNEMEEKEIKRLLEKFNNLGYFCYKEGGFDMLCVFGNS